MTLPMEIELIEARGRRLASDADELRAHVDALVALGPAMPQADWQAARAAYARLCDDLAVLAALIERELPKHAQEAPEAALSLRRTLETVWAMLGKQAARRGGD